MVAAQELWSLFGSSLVLVAYTSSRRVDGWHGQQGKALPVLLSTTTIVATQLFYWWTAASPQAGSAPRRQAPGLLPWAGAAAAVVRATRDWFQPLCSVVADLTLFLILSQSIRPDGGGGTHSIPVETMYIPLLLVVLVTTSWRQPFSGSRALVLAGQLVSLACVLVTARARGDEPAAGSGAAEPPRGMSPGVWGATIIVLSAVYSAVPSPAPGDGSSRSQAALVHTACRVGASVGVIMALPSASDIGGSGSHFRDLLLLYDDGRGTGGNFWWACKSLLGRTALLGSCVAWWGACCRNLFSQTPLGAGSQQASPKGGHDGSAWAKHRVDTEELALLGATMCASLAGACSRGSASSFVSSPGGGGGEPLLYGQIALLASGASVCTLWAWSRGLGGGRKTAVW